MKLDLRHVGLTAWAWRRGRQKLRYMPKDVSIEPTNYCNYRCNFCPQSDPAHQALPKGFMALDDLDDILDKVQAANAAWHNVINYTHDGEPFLHPEFPEMVRRATIRGYRTRFSTNGSRFTPEKIDALIACNARFRASIDFSGSPEIFEKYRGRKGDWPRVRDHLAYAIKVSNRHPGVRLEISEIADWAEPGQGAHQLERLKASLPRPTSGRVRFLIRNFHNAAGLVPLRLPNQADQPDQPKPQPTHRCPYPWVSLNIAWNGDIHVCPRDLRGRTLLGNILKVNHLEEIWNGQPYQQFRNAHVQGKLDGLAACSNCDLPWRNDPQRWGLKRIWYRIKDE